MTGRPVGIDRFFRSLTEAHGQHACALLKLESALVTTA
jgi:hypothetical protein